MLYLVIFIAAILVFLLFLNIHIVVEYIRNGWDDHIVFAVSALKGLLKYKIEIPLVDIEKTGVRFKKYDEVGSKEKKVDEVDSSVKFMEMYERLQFFNKMYTAFKPIICNIRDYIKGRTIVEEFSVDIDLGAGLPHYTGILSGMVWSLYGATLSFLSNYFTLEKKHVRIKNDFSSIKLNINLFCIFKFKLVYIMVIGIKILIYYLKNRFSIKNSVIGGGVSG